MTLSFHESERTGNPRPASPPREIDVHIEELVLHGFCPNARHDLAEALERELRTHLAAHGLPESWRGNPSQLQAASLPISATSKPALVGEQVARAALGGNAS